MSVVFSGVKKNSDCPAKFPRFYDSDPKHDNIIRLWHEKFQGSGCTDVKTFPRCQRKGDDAVERTG